LAAHDHSRQTTTDIGTNFSNDPKEIAEKVTNAVCADPSQWMRPVHGSVSIAEHGSFDIAAVEFADGIYGILVDEIDAETSDRVNEHSFDEACEPLADKPREAQSLLNALQVTMSVLEAVRATNPALIADNMPADWGMNRLRSVLAGAETSFAPTEQKVKPSSGASKKAM